jgi:hypothetical protein
MNAETNNSIQTSLGFHLWVESNYPSFIPLIRYNKSCTHVSTKFNSLLEKIEKSIDRIKCIKIYGDRMKITYYRDTKGTKKKYIYMDISNPEPDKTTIRSFEHEIYTSPELYIQNHKQIQQQSK